MYHGEVNLPENKIQKTWPLKKIKDYIIIQFFPGKRWGGGVASAAQDCWGAQGDLHDNVLGDNDDNGDGDDDHEDDHGDDDNDDDNIPGEGSGGVRGGEAGWWKRKSYSGNFLKIFTPIKYSNT